MDDGDVDGDIVCGRRIEWEKRERERERESCRDGAMVWCPVEMANGASVKSV